MALDMKKVASNGPVSNQEPIDPGVYPGRLVQIIDLGLQPQRPYKGQEKAPTHEIMLTYELVDEFIKDEEGNDVEDKPRWISETFPFYGPQADKSKCFKRYQALDPDNEFEYDFSRTIGSPINITIVQNENKERIYNNVANIAPMRPKEAANCPDLVNPAKVFDCDSPDLEVFNSLPDWIKEKITTNLNFEGSVLQEALGAGEGKKAPKVAKKNRKPKEEKEESPPWDEEDDEDQNPY